MITLRKAILGSALVLALPMGGAAVAQITTSSIEFARGTTSTTVAGTITGDQIQDYVITASAGQEMQVTKSGSDIVYFNILPPGSNDAAIFTGSTEGNTFAGTLSASGGYRIRVYQMRATARRGERGTFNLAVSVSRAGGGGASQVTHVTHGSGPGLDGLAGMDSIAGIDEMANRGFANVDDIESGGTHYGIFYNRETKVCAQLTLADGKVLDARDIQTHPKCR